MTTDTISIELDEAERHTLVHLLDNYIRERALDAIKCAHGAGELHEGAERARLLAQLHGLTEDDASLPVADLDAHRANLISWAMETESTVDEHEASLVEADESDSDRREIAKTIDNERGLIVVDYAHKCVCNCIIRQIDAVREPVAA